MPAEPNTEIKPSTVNDVEEQLERQAVLGLLVGGIVHEIANPLNAILMNAELGLLYLAQNGESDDLKDALNSIAKEAKRGGVLAQELLRFARSSDYAPQANGKFDEAIALAGKLLGSKLRRNGVELAHRKIDVIPGQMLNSTALALVFASLIDLLIAMGIKRIEIIGSCDSDEVVVKLTFDGPNSTAVENNRYNELVFSFARRVMQAHAGVLSINEGAFSLHFPANKQKL